MANLKGSETYQRLADKIRSGDLSPLIDPLDYKILEVLPDEGTMFGGLYQIGETAAGINKKLGGGIPPGSLASRLKIFDAAGMSVAVRMVGSQGKRAYQRTEYGKELLDKWLLTQG